MLPDGRSALSDRRSATREGAGRLPDGRLGLEGRVGVLHRADDLPLGGVATHHRLDHHEEMVLLLVGLPLDRVSARGERLADRAEQRSLAEGLQHVASGTGVGSALEDLRLAVAGQGHDRHVALAEDARCGVEPVEARESEVEHDQVGSVLARALDGLVAVARVGDDREAGVLEDHAQVGAHDRIVVDGQDPGWCECLVNVLPALRVCDGASWSEREGGPGYIPESLQRPSIAMPSGEPDEV